MKKIILSMALAAMTIAVSAQSFSYGIKAGMNVSSIGGKDVKGEAGEALKNKIGYYFGVATEIGLSDKFAVAPELLYSAQGAKVKIGDVTGSMKFNYLNLPVLFKYNITDNWSVGLGPQFGYCISAKAKGDGETVKIPSDSYTKFDLSGAVGTTYKFGKVYVDARYTYGFTKFMKEEDIKAKAYNRVFQVGVGYNF